MNPPMWLLCCLLHLLIPLSTAKQGFLLTSPSSLTSGATETLYLTLFDVADKGKFNVTLVQNTGNTVVTLSTIIQAVNQPSPVSGQSFTISLPVPVMLDGTSVTMIVAGQLGKYAFTNRSVIMVYVRGDATFVQTDKPIYNPGQLVRFRILAIDSKLNPLSGSTAADIWIENPSAVRLSQWLKVTFQDGLQQFEMKLADQPSLGQWSISVNLSTDQIPAGRIIKQTFKVAEYVLPKFQVIVTPPPFVLANSDDIVFQICGKYTYGKMVKGTLKITANYVFGGNYNFDNKIMQNITKIDGCTSYIMNLKNLPYPVNYYDYNYYYYQPSVKLTAIITEDGTGVQQNSSAIITPTQNPVLISFSYPDPSRSYFKPGLPFHGQITVSNPDQSPRINELIEICATPIDQNSTIIHKKICKKYTTNFLGIVDYYLPPQIGGLKFINLLVSAVNFPSTVYLNYWRIYSPSNTVRLSSWYSKSQRYILIDKSLKPTTCGKMSDFVVYLNGKQGDIINLYTQTLSRDGIISESLLTYKYSDITAPLKIDPTLYLSDTVSVTQTLGSVVVSVSIAYDISPVGYLLVYYVTTDGEIIADSVDFDVPKCLKNEVKMDFPRVQALPGEDVELRVTANPNSLCGIQAIDKSVYLLGSSNIISIENVFNNLMNLFKNRFQRTFISPECIPTQTPAYSSRYFYPRKSRSNYADSLTAFQNGHFTVITDLTLVTKPCETERYRYYDYPYEKGSVPLPMFADGGGGGVPDMAKVSDASGPVPSPNGDTQPVASPPIEKIRNKFPETWLWEIDLIDVSGVMDVKRTLPDTITEWVGSTVCLHPQDGLGISSPANITAFQPFFVSATLPYSVIRGEITPVIVTVFNYLTGCLPITLKLDQIDGFTLTSGSLVQSLCVCGSDSVTYNYLVKTSQIGQLNLTIHASADTGSKACGGKIIEKITQAKDAVTNVLLVEAEGFKKQISFSNFTCLPQESTFNILQTLVLPSNVVANSSRAELLITGDLMGAALNNLDSLVQMPTGCGEQNMLSFVPDIFVLDYLTDTGTLTSDMKTKLLNYLQIGYQRELTYRHSDGSYSAFGQSDSSGSNWLTAFVVKAFARASRYIYIDQSDISKSVAWLEINQAPDGCFLEIGSVIHIAMRGGTVSNGGSSATLTSYILISLLEANINLDPDTIQNGFQCLAKAQNPSIYTLALMTYASCLRSDSSSAARLDKLMTLRQIQGDTEFWLDDSTNSKSIQVEIASYAILSILKCGVNDQAKALPVVRWLTSQMNANGGFVSTQDTVMALQALATYASTVAQNPLNMDITLYNSNTIKTFHVGQDNKILVQSTPISNISSTVQIQGKGTGCVLLQVNLFYNIKAPIGLQNFRLILSTAQGADNNCKNSVITACVSFNYNNLYSNMAVLELRLLSGYQVDTTTLDKLVQDSTQNIKLHTNENNVVAIYFSKIGPRVTCFSFTLNQIFQVQNLQPGTGKLYDYYQPENQVSKSYQITQSCKQT